MLRRRTRQARYVEQLSVECTALASAILALVGDKPTIRLVDDATLRAFRQMASEIRTVGTDLSLVALTIDQHAAELEQQEQAKS